ncbi:MAG: DUF359 domain-containing protein [Promethearchaeia archaeon]
MDIEIDHDLKLPLDKRHVFAKPLDMLIAGNREETILQVENLLKDYLNKKEEQEEVNYYLVGDIVAEDFLSSPSLAEHVNLCIIDEKTQRKKIKMESKTKFEQIIEFENPAGLIVQKSWAIIKNALDTHKKTLIKITEGEEDLLLIPLVLLLPLGQERTHFVFYGQPPITDANLTIPQGIVVVKVDEKIQQEVKNMLSYLKIV